MTTISNKIVVFIFKYIIVGFLTILSLLFVFHTARDIILGTNDFKGSAVMGLLVSLLASFIFTQLFLMIKNLYRNEDHFIIGKNEIRDDDIKVIFLMPEGNHNGVLLKIKSVEWKIPYVYTILKSGKENRKYFRKDASDK